MTAKAILIGLLLAFSGLDLTPDEAQYWTWSRTLDFGYYSKPPGIAWQIYAGTNIFGDNLWGIKAGSFFLSFCIALAVYALGKKVFIGETQAVLAALFFAFSPFGILSSMLAITDVGCTLFFTLALYLCMRRFPEIDLVSVGAMIGLGALFKWPIYFLWPLLFFAGWKEKAIFNRPFLGIGISFLGLTPSLYWNVQHDYVTFRHVLATLFGEHQRSEIGTTPLQAGNFFEFLGAQALLVTPPLFFLIFVGIYYTYRKNKKLAFLSWSFLLPFIGALVLSVFQKLQGNWIDFSYPAAFLLASSLFPRFQAVSKSVFVISFTMVVSAFSIVPLQEGGILPPSRFLPFKHALGWTEMQKALDEIGYRPNKHALVADTYQMASLLSFYNTEKKRAYFLNLRGARFNQFSFWEPLRKGANGFFVVQENMPFHSQREVYFLTLLEPYFRNVSYIGSKSIYAPSSCTVKRISIFYFEDFLGNLPPQPNRF